MDVTVLMLAAEAGAVAGCLAGDALRGHGLGLLANAAVGLLGGLVGGWLLQRSGLPMPVEASVSALIVHTLVSGLIGAAVVLLAGWGWNRWRTHKHRPLPPPHRSSHR